MKDPEEKVITYRISRRGYKTDRQVFNGKQEAILFRYLIKFRQIYCGLSIKDVRQLPFRAY